MPEFKEEITAAVSEALGGAMPASEIAGLIEKPPSPELGDLAFPCFKLAPLLKKAPQQIASELASKIKLPPGIEKAVPLGPYLNFFVKQESLAEQTIPKILKQGEKFGSCKSLSGKKILVEYSSPNTNKPLHIGHLRNDSIGMAVSNILEANGAKIIRANLVNDRGIHICKSMLAYQLFGKGGTPQKEKMKSDHFVGKYYVLYNKKAAENAELEKQAYGLLQKWEKGDKKTIALWKKMNDWVLFGFRETYAAFGSRFDQWFFESKFFDKASGTIELGKKKGVFSPNEEGALLARLEKHGLPDKTVLRSDGTAIYMTNDLALTKHKFEKFGIDEALWVVGSEQNLYFRQLFKIFELLGFEWAKRCRHLSYGMVCLPEGKLKSREGKVVDADDLIKEMRDLAGEEVAKREKRISKKELASRSKAIGLAAIKFYMLRIGTQKDLLFDPKKSISFEGETGPYIQYTYARAKSILRKAKKANKQSLHLNQLGSPEEKQLVSLLNSFPSAVEKSASSMSPHAICNFLIETAAAFNRFYHAHPVLQAENSELRNERLALVQATAQVLKNGLHLLNIEAIERM